ncbi:ribonuclease BN protein [Halorhabdus tiamatea SARL4B]|uniref:Ribonuclease BN n=1 Tax=Halorhabdus tiamatea SARL4B TaxID=1033806 RepID=F7PNW9_9EURY|nr:YihY/virulence factor BrkB family protein [Halorhabdus tiamatea]ERJ05368.1 ribonuclease BN protein [Halorhabdus tiamatea SARL4B]CCQ33637.1 ribonuclease BN [Halorhabdus tiamatea SARL4B]
MTHLVRDPVGTGRAILAQTREARLSFVAAATAYYAFVSIFPLALLVVAVGTLLGGEALAEQIVAGVASVLSPSGQSLLEDAIAGVGGRSEATVIGVVGLLWSGLRVFRGLDTAFATVYDTVEDHSFLEQVRNALLALFALGIGVLAVVASHLLFGRIALPLAGVPDAVALTAALSVALLPLYAVFPDVPVSLRAALPGAITAAVGWTVLSVLFTFYTAHAAIDVYGVVAGALLFVTWLYFGAQILLLGAVVNAVLLDRDRQLQLAGDPSASHPMTGTDGTAGDGPDDDETEPPDAPDAATDATAVDRDDGADAQGGDTPGGDAPGEIEELREEIERLEDEIDDRTVHRERVESDLRRYVRRRVRRGHAHGWGPYLVLLYGTAMTLGAFYFLGGGWAVLAMLVIWLSTLGLYALMLLVGVTFKAIGTPGRLLDRLRDWRS